MAAVSKVDDDIQVGIITGGVESMRKCAAYAERNLADILYVLDVPPLRCGRSTESRMGSVRRQVGCLSFCYTFVVFQA